jgi:hypothetical protein
MSAAKTCVPWQALRGHNFPAIAPGTIGIIGISTKPLGKQPPKPD